MLPSTQGEPVSRGKDRASLDWGFEWPPIYEVLGKWWPRRLAAISASRDPNDDEMFEKQSRFHRSLEGSACLSGLRSPGTPQP